MTDYQTKDRRALRIYWAQYRKHLKHYQDERNSVEYRNLARQTMIDMIGAIRRKQGRLRLQQTYFDVPPEIKPESV